MKRPQSKIGEALVEAINAIIGETVRANGGADHGQYHKQVAQIMAKVALAMESGML